MKIGFDASDLCTDRADGTTRYTREVLARLPGLMSNDEIDVFAPCTRDVRDVVWHGSPFPKYWTQARLPFELFAYKPDVLFMPIQQLPIFRPPSMRSVSVIHDLAFHEYGRQTTFKDWLLLHAFTAQVAREADSIIAVSQSTANDIARIYDRTYNVHVVHHGVDMSRFRKPTGSEREQGWTQLQTAYPDLQAPYILYIGQIQPRKNIERLIGAFEQLKQSELFSDHQLVIAGGHGWLQQPIVERVHTSPHANAIQLLGRVPDELLPALYWNASVFTLPSLYEGFGMPLLEAMACGVPVVTSDVSSMPEVVGGAGVTVDPLDVSAIAEGIMKAFTEREQFISAGFDRVQAFSWERSATKIVDILHQTT